MRANPKNISSKKPHGFTFVEIMITLALFFLMASIGLGIFFQYFTFSLITQEVTATQSLIKSVRFKAQKNPDSSRYGVHLDTGTNLIIGFKEPFVMGNSSNDVVHLEQLTIKDLNLMPNVGVTDEILFEAGTAKTTNTGSFTIGNDDFDYTFNVNAQGGIE